MTSDLLGNPSQQHGAGQRRIADRYRLLERKSSGRLGEIFSAIDDSFGEFGVEQALAVQVVPERIVRNNRLYNKLNVGYAELRAAAHPNIGSYLEFGRDGDIGYLVMDAVDGEPLRAVLDEAEALQFNEVLPVVRGIGEALCWLHAKGIVHGNLSARNVFITLSLEVRLLDVLPIDASEAIVGTNSVNDPLSRRTPEDDVFALGCLTYEMLSGRHPFNFRTQAEAKSEGLVPDRLSGMPDDAWEALRQVLSFSDGERITSVDEFMRRFGIRGSERLQRPAVSVAPEVVEPTVQAPETQTAAPQPMPAPAAVSTMAATRNRPSTLRPVVLGMALAGLATWTYVGEPEEAITGMIGFVDNRLDLGLAPTVEPPVVWEPAPVVAAIEPAPIIDSEPAVDIVGESPTEPVEETAVGETSADAETSDGFYADIIIDVGDARLDQKIDPMADPLDEPAEFVTETIVSVTESAGSARIFHNNGKAWEKPLVVWTSSHTARADSDFIGMENLVASRSSGSDVVHIPLVNDSLPEPRESFFVNFGLHDDRAGHIQRIATVRVDIVDDDSP